jgi:hypothetical protein
MTPSAVTPAGRAATKKRSAASQRAGDRASAASPAQRTGVPGHKRGVSQRAAPKAPRRVSGPVRGRAADAVVPKPAPSRTRRPTAPPRTRRPTAPIGVRVVAFVRALPDHPLLDRLIRGRVWIPLLGVMLAGIVAMQVEVLKLNASIGRSIERGTALQNRNEQLRMAVAALDGDQRILRLAAAKGMIMPAPDSVGFLSSRSGSDVVRQATQNIHVPDASGFLSLISSNGAIASTSSSQPTDVSQLSSSSGAGASTDATVQQTSSTASGTASGAQGTAVTSASSAQPSATTSASSTQSTSATSATGTGVAATSTGSQSQSSGSSSGGAGIPVGG